MCELEWWAANDRIVVFSDKPKHDSDIGREPNEEVARITSSSVDEANGAAFTGSARVIVVTQ